MDSNKLHGRCRVLGLVALLAAIGSVQAMHLPLAFFFDDPEDDREEAIEKAGEWKASEMATIDRPAFTLKYPSGWTIAKHQADYNPDRLFTIETPGSSHIAIEIFDLRPGMNVSETMRDVLQALDGPAVETYSYGDFETWGHYQGEGKHLKGKIMSLIPGGCRVFVAKIPEKGKGLLITEFYMSDDLPEAHPGFDLISQTLVFK